MDDNKYPYGVIIQVFNYKITKLLDYFLWLSNQWLLWLFSEIDYNNIKNLVDYSNFNVITKLLM